MLRIQGYFLYRTGYEIHFLWNLKPGYQTAEWIQSISIAQNSLRIYLAQSVFRPQLCFDAGMNLFKVLESVLREQPLPEEFTQEKIWQITGALGNFESVLAAELGQTDLYLVRKKNGFNTRDLIDLGETCFPAGLAAKAPEAIPDVKAATRCIAFALPTAAGFHLHRANESVLHSYWDAVTDNAPRPTRSNGKRPANMGDYLDELGKLGKGDAKVIAALRSLKDLHRNPLMHPEESLETVDEAIALMGAIHSVMVPMLERIPDKSPAVLSPSGLALTSNDEVVKVPFT